MIMFRLKGSRLKRRLHAAKSCASHLLQLQRDPPLLRHHPRHRRKGEGGEDRISFDDASNPGKGSGQESQFERRTKTASLTRVRHRTQSETATAVKK